MIVLCNHQLFLFLLPKPLRNFQPFRIFLHKFIHHFPIISLLLKLLQQQPRIPQLLSLILFTVNVNLHRFDNIQSIVSIQMDGLTCEHCKGISSEFTILRCDHIICAECLWGEVKATLNGVNTIQCTCGVITKFAPQSNLATNSHHTNANITVTTSPRRQTTKNYRTEAATLSVRAPSSPQRSRFIQDRENSELHAELEFLGVQFKKSMEEAERNFRRVVESIRGKYNNLVKNIRMFWFQEVVESRPILQLPKLLMRKYQKSVGQTLQSLNDSFLQQLTSFRLETLPAPRVFSACKLHHNTKENLPTLSNTCLQQRRKLMQAIDQLKQRGIRKIARKVKPVFHYKN